MNCYTIRQITRRVKELIISRWTVLILMGIWLFHMVNDYIWLSRDDSYQIFDAHYRFLTSLHIFRSLKNSSLLNAIGNVTAFLKADNDWHGFFVQLLTAPFYFIFGTSQDAGIMINSTVFLAVLIFSVYGVAYKLFGRRAGLLAAFIVSMYPYVFVHSRIYMLDLPLAAMVTLSMYLLLMTDRFQNRKFSLLFGFVMGFGLLTKFNFAAFIVGPLSCILIEIFFKSKAKRSKVFYINFFSSFFIAVLLFSLYLIPRCSFFYNKLTKVFVGEGGGVAYGNLAQTFQSKGAFVYILTLLHPLIWHIQVLMNRVISFIFFFAFVVEGWIFFRSKTKMRWFLATWIIIPLFLLITYSVYEDRLMLPFLPSMAVITAVGITTIAKRRIQRTIIVGLVILGITQYWAISYGIEVLPKRIKIPLPHFGKVRGRYDDMSLIKDILVFDQRKKHFSEFRLFKTLQIPQMDEILDAITSSMKEDNIMQDSLKGKINGFAHRKSVLFFDYIPYIYEPLMYEAFAQELPINIMVNPYIGYSGRVVFTEIEDIFGNVEYIITKEGGATYKKNVRLKCEDEFFDKIEICRMFLKKNINKVGLIKQIQLSDYSVLSIYKNKTK